MSKSSEALAEELDDFAAMADIPGAVELCKEFIEWQRGRRSLLSLRSALLAFRLGGRAKVLIVRDAQELHDAIAESEAEWGDRVKTAMPQLAASLAAINELERLGLLAGVGDDGE